MLRRHLQRGLKALSRIPCKHASSSSVVYSWGVGTRGELGVGNVPLTTAITGDYYIQAEPRRLVRSKRFKAVAVGSSFSLGLDRDGMLFEWGDSPSGSKHMQPEPVDSSVKFSSIACGKSHCAAVSEDGQVYTWGSNGSWMAGGGYLGHGNTVAVKTPKQIQAFKVYGAKAADVVCGHRHTVIRTTDGEVLSCGVGEYGRLGTGSSFDALEPVPLDALVDENVTRLAAGSSHTLALAKSGKLFVWGRNDYGQLGFEDSYMDMYSLEDIPRELDADAFKGKQITEVLAGRGRSGVITSDGLLYTWGHRASHSKHYSACQHQMHYYLTIVYVCCVVPLVVDPKHFNNLAVVQAAFGGDIMGNSCLAVVTEDGGLWTCGDAGSHLIGRGLGMGEGGLSRLPEPTRVSAFVGRRVLEVCMGAGQHAFAVVEVDATASASEA